MIVIDLCLSDIPNSACRKSEKNGKIYVKLVVDKRKEPDQFKNDHTLYVNQTKEQREAKENKCYVGNGKEVVFEHKDTPAENPFNTNPEPIKINSQPESYEYSDQGQSDDNLPF